MKKKPSKLLILFLVVLVGMIAFVLFILNALLSGGSNDKYGNRLNNIEEYTINEAQIEEIEDNISINENVGSVTYNLEGRLVNYIIKVTDVTEIEVARSYATIITEVFEEDQNSYYDIQVYLTSENEESLVYPQIGTKSKSSENFVWKQ